MSILLVQHVMLYGAETWTSNRHHANKPLAREADFWRKKQGNQEKDKIRNLEIIKNLNVKDNIIETI